MATRAREVLDTIGGAQDGAGGGSELPTTPVAKRMQLRGVGFSTAEKHAAFRSADADEGTGLRRQKPLQKGDGPIDASGRTGNTVIEADRTGGTALAFDAVGDASDTPIVDKSSLAEQVVTACHSRPELWRMVIETLLESASSATEARLMEMCRFEILGDLSQEAVRDARDVSVTSESDEADMSESDDSSENETVQVPSGPSAPAKYCPFCARLPRAKNKPPNGWCWATSPGFLDGVLGPENQRPREPNYDDSKWNGTEETVTASSGGDPSPESDETTVSKAEMRSCQSRLTDRMPDYEHRATVPRRFRHCTGRQKRLVLYYVKLFTAIYGTGKRGVQEDLPKCCVAPIRFYWPDDVRDLLAISRR